MTKKHPDANHWPPIQHVKIYFDQKGMPEFEADKFCEFYKKQHWTSKNGRFYKDWKQIAFRWIAHFVKHHPFLFDRRIH